MQNSNGIPFNFYDHIAVLFPGAILLSYFIIVTSWVFPNTLNYLLNLNNLSTAIFVLLFLILSFIFGHIAYTISKRSFEVGINSKKPVDKFLDFSSVKQEEIITEVEKIYGNNIGEELRFNLLKYKNNKITGSQFGLKNYCYALVERKEIKHDMFVALADFLRSTAFLLIIPGLSLIVMSLVKLYSNDINIINFIIYFLYSLLPIAASNLLYKRSIRMRKAADSIIYSQFLYDAKKNKLDI
ncbi:hypothetical protein [Cytobacillus firmus]|uniref:hypothetical protein n=1 Tax=Cytobacillus firmus TaxID=1399 RepID=UPI0030032F91